MIWPHFRTYTLEQTRSYEGFVVENGGMDTRATGLARGKQRGIRRLRTECAMENYTVARGARRQCERTRRYCADG